MSVLAAGVLVSALAGAFSPERAAASSGRGSDNDLVEVFGTTLHRTDVKDRLAALDPAPVAPALARCLARNEALPQRATGDSWQARGAQSVVGPVLTALGTLAGEPGGKGERTLPGGLISYGLDPANSRVVVMVDPALLDPSTLRRELNRVARAASRSGRVTGPAVSVAVQRGCFTAAELTEARDLVAATIGEEDFGTSRGRERIGWSLDGQARMDSRIHLTLHPGDRAAGDDLERRLGGRLAVDYAAPLDWR